MTNGIITKHIGNAGLQEDLSLITINHNIKYGLPFDPIVECSSTVGYNT
jgi:hypothetical protein